MARISGAPVVARVVTRSGRAHTLRRHIPRYVRMVNWFASERTHHLGIHFWPEVKMLIAQKIGERKEAMQETLGKEARKARGR